MIRSLEFGPEHLHAKAYTKVALSALLPYLDDYIMVAHDPFVEDFHWSMDDNRHTEPSHRSSLRATCRIFCLLRKEMSSTVRTEAAGSVAQVAGRDTRGARAFAQTEIKGHRQGQER